MCKNYLRSVQYGGCQPSMQPKVQFPFIVLHAFVSTLATSVLAVSAICSVQTTCEKYGLVTDIFRYKDTLIRDMCQNNVT